MLVAILEAELRNTQLASLGNRGELSRRLLTETLLKCKFKTIIPTLNLNSFGTILILI